MGYARDDAPGRALTNKGEQATPFGGYGSFDYANDWWNRDLSEYLGVAPEMDTASSAAFGGLFDYNQVPGGESGYGSYGFAPAVLIPVATALIKSSGEGQRTALIAGTSDAATLLSQAGVIGTGGLATASAMRAALEKFISLTGTVPASGAPQSDGILKAAQAAHPDLPRVDPAQYAYRPGMPAPGPAPTDGGFFDNILGAVTQPPNTGGIVGSPNQPGVSRPPTQAGLFSAFQGSTGLLLLSGLGAYLLFGRRSGGRRSYRRNRHHRRR
jgi:hypothetical protein